MNITNKNGRLHKTKNVYPNKRVTARWNPGHVAQSIKNIANGIHEGSYKIRKTAQILHQSGAINELTHAVYEATVAARDTTSEIRDTALDLKDDRIISSTATAIQETTGEARVTVDTVRDIATYRGEKFPKAIMTKLPEWP